MSLQGTLNFEHGSDDPLYFGQNRFLTPIQIDIKIKMNSLIQIFFYYNISFFNVNRKIKFHSDFTLFLHYYTLSQKIFYNSSCNFIIKFHRHNV